MVYRGESQGPIVGAFGRFDDWVRWAVGGVVAGLIAYGSVGSRISALETAFNISTVRASEDRAEVKASVEQLRSQLQALTMELRQEEDQRKEGERTKPPFIGPYKFDK